MIYEVWIVTINCVSGASYTCFVPDDEWEKFWEHTCQTRYGLFATDHFTYDVLIAAESDRERRKLKFNPLSTIGREVGQYSDAQIKHWRTGQELHNWQWDRAT